jgi:chemotaxis protein CheX
VIDLEREIVDIVSQIASIQLGWEVHTVDDPPGSAPEGESITASVQISGAFDGAVHVTCPRSVAVEAAGRMFGRPARTLMDDEVRDALGELSNMVAGNFKSRLPGRCRLSLPTVVEGSGYEVTRLGSRLEAEAELATSAGRVRVRVYRSVVTTS